MKEHLHDIEFIERYFDNALSAEETKDLKQRLERDFEFQKLFEQEKALVQTIRLQGAKKDLEFLKEIESSFGESKPRRVKALWYFYAAAACIGLIALAVFFSRRGNDPETLFAAHFQPHPNVFEPTLRGERPVNLRSQAFQAYDAQDYERAATLFADLLKENSEPGALLLLGNANLILGKSAEAKQNLSDLIAGSDELDTEASWYLSLCYLKTGETLEARKLLQEVARTETSYALKAQQILEKLESM